MGPQHTVGPLLPIELERQVVGIQPPFTTGDQGPQGVRLHQLVQRLGVGNGEMGWQVHGNSLIRLTRPYALQRDHALPGAGRHPECAH